MSLGRLVAIFRPLSADQYRHYPTPRLAVWSFQFGNTPACEAAVSFPMRPDRRFPMHSFLTSSGFGNRGVGGHHTVHDAWCRAVSPGC